MIPKSQLKLSRRFVLALLTLAVYVGSYFVMGTVQLPPKRSVQPLSTNRIFKWSWQRIYTPLGRIEMTLRPDVMVRFPGTPTARPNCTG